jgi:uncharacterized membrane protein YfcA
MQQPGDLRGGEADQRGREEINNEVQSYEQECLIGYLKMDMNIFIYILVGFLAQMIDGSLGMAYGVSSNTFLLSVGVPPAAASATVHMAEVVITGVSGAFHWRLGNIDWSLVKRLLLPGVIGGVLGAYLLTSIPASILKPYISAYLAVMGIIIIIKAIRKKIENREQKHIGILGLIGGFFDAVGGGGWGPIVTTTLVARGKEPRYAIGSVNFSEFFVTLSESVTFILTLHFREYWQIILGLLIGGVIAAPLAAHLAKKVPTRALMLIVGALIIFLSVRTMLQAIP